MVHDSRRNTHNHDDEGFAKHATIIWNDIERKLQADKRCDEQRREALQTLLNARDVVIYCMAKEEWAALLYRAFAQAAQCEDWGVCLALWELIKIALLARAKRSDEVVTIVQNVLQACLCPHLAQDILLTLIEVVKDPKRGWDVPSLEYIGNLLFHLYKLRAVDAVEYAQLYLALAVRYIHLHEHRQAQKCSEYTLSLLREVDDPLAYGKAALTLAVAYRLEADWEQCQRYLARAGEAFARTDAPYQHTLFLQAHATILFDQNLYEDALQHLDRAELELERTPDFAAKPYHRAAIVQTKAMTLVELGRYDEAAPYLRRAAVLWKQLDNTIELLCVFNSWGELEFRRGNYEQARSHWCHVKNHLPEHPSSERERELQQLVEENLARL